jgi:hypothetical protein
VGNWVNWLLVIGGVICVIIELAMGAMTGFDLPTLRVYKCYEMVVEDNLGFRLCFSMDHSLKGA